MDDRTLSIPRHIEYLNDRLLALASGEILGLIVAMPPQHGKSTIGSVYFPAWWLMRYPEHKVLIISNSEDLVESFGWGVRKVVERWGPALFGVRIHQDSHAVHRFRLAGHRGRVDSMGIYGQITGKGGDLVVCDDLIKGPDDLTDTKRKKAWNTWQASVESRATPQTRYVVIATRWSEDDVSGRIIQQIEAGEREGWEVLTLPAIADHDPLLGESDPLGREPGEALWPERYPADYLNAYRLRSDHQEASAGPNWFDALYQGKPCARDGAMFKRQWFRYYEEDSEFYILEKPGRHEVVKKADCWNIISVDPAVSEKQTADFFALGVWAVTPSRDLVLLEVVHDRIPGPDQTPLIKRMNERYQPSFVGIESVAYQLALIQSVEREGINVREVKAVRDKVARAQGPATRFCAGTVFFPKEAPWLGDLEKELLVFPNGRNDDLVDMVSIAANELASSSPIEVYA